MESNPCYLFQFFLLYKAWAGMETVLEFVSLYYEQQINITVLSPPKYCVMPTRRVCQSLHKGANSKASPWTTLALRDATHLYIDRLRSSLVQLYHVTKLNEGRTQSVNCQALYWNHPISVYVPLSSFQQKIMSYLGTIYRILVVNLYATQYIDSF